MSEAAKLIQAMEDPEPAVQIALAEFEKKYETTKVFDFMSKKEKRSLYDVLFEITKNEDNRASGLNCLRLLSRDKDAVEREMTKERVAKLLHYSGLSEKTGPQDLPHVMALKVIYNMVFQSVLLQGLFIEAGFLPPLVDHIDPTFTEIKEEHLDFVLKITFIITAVNQTAKKIVRDELDGIEKLVRRMDKYGRSSDRFNAANVTYLSDCLKIMYNLINDLYPPGYRQLTEETLKSKIFEMVRELTWLSRKFLVCDVEPPMSLKLELHTHTVHVLTSVPSECLDELFKDDDTDTHVHIRLGENKEDLAGINAIVNLLNAKLDEREKSSATPVILALIRFADKFPVGRRYLKERILPPLTKEDVINRPEVGNKLRNKLCAIMKSANTDLSQMTAQLLFILCKENVNKFVKYTGYGNAAGFLADRGLLLGGKGGGDTSEDSDTDEYSKIKDEIDPVEGCIKAIEPPIEMTEEQKEYEAMKLVESINKLSTSKIIQPCRIGPDGKPHPVDHVLELQDALECCIKGGPSTESDSD